MKKTIQLPDGSLETIEGTPEELADYARKSGDVKESKKGKRKLLTEADVMGLIQKHSAPPLHLCVGCSICQPWFIYRGSPDHLYRPQPWVKPDIVWTTAGDTTSISLPEGTSGETFTTQMLRAYGRETA